MNSKLTASDARKLAGVLEDNEICEIVDNLLVAVKNEAEKGKRKLRTGWEYKGDKSVWIYGGYNRTALWLACKMKLEDLGYKVTFYYSVHSIAVDMYTLVEW